MSEGERPSGGRSSGRVKMNAPAEIKGLKGLVKAPVRDISMEGCRVLSPEKFPVGESLQIIVRLPSRVEIPAEIRWVKEDGAKDLFILGCKFAHTTESRQALKTALQTMASSIDSAAKRVK